MDLRGEPVVYDLRELGQTGNKRFSGFLYNDFLPELQGWRGIERYKEMQYNSPVIGGCLFAIRTLCRRVQWRVRPATQQPFDQAAGQYLDTCINDMDSSWPAVVDVIMRNMLPYGHSPHEIVYKRRAGMSLNPSMRSKYADGRIGWRKIEIRAPDTVWRWQFDDHGGIQGFYQLAAPHYNHTYIPMKKLALFRTTTDLNNPEGFSMLRHAFRPYYMAKNLENIEAIGVERDLAGLPVAEVPPELLSSNASLEQKALYGKIKEIVTNIRRDEQEGVVWPQQYGPDGKPMYNLKLLTTGGSRQFDTDKIIQRYNMLQAMTLLADFMFMGHNAGGNRSILDNRTNLFTTAICAFLDMIAEVMNTHVIPELFALNPDIEMSGYPILEHGDLESMDLEVLAKFITACATAGAPMFPNDDFMKWLMKAMHAPEPIDPMKLSEELEIEPQKKPPPSKQVEIPAEPYAESTNDNLSTLQPEPGIPPAVPGQGYGEPVVGAGPQSMFAGPQSSLT